jgi:hypothetical protein
LSNKLPEALLINVFLAAKANRAERQSGFAGIVQDLGKSAKRVHKKPHRGDGNHSAALLLRNQPGDLKLFNSDRHPALAASAAGPHGSGG